MTVPTKIQHPLLKHPGTSQRKRISRAYSLSPELAPVDGRGLGDMLEFIHEYARLVVFREHKTDAEGKAYVELGNWLNFYEKSLPFKLNHFARTDFDQLENELQILRKRNEQTPNKTVLCQLLDYCYHDLIKPFARLQQVVHASNFEELVSELDRSSRTSLQKPLQRFIELSNASVKYFCTSKYDFMGFTHTPWDIPIEDLFIVDAKVDTIPGGKSGALKWLGDELVNIAQLMLVVQRGIAARTPDFLNASIHVPGKQNQPHLGLLFAFFRLFKHFQGELNGLTQKHLEFFLSQVLQLKPRGMTPDKVHLVFESAKRLESYLVKAGTLFKDGKDGNKADILFGLDNEIVIDKAKVVSLKTLYLDSTEVCLPDNSKKTESKSYVKGLYIAPVANSADGQGEQPFTEEQSKNWATLGSKPSKYSVTNENDDDVFLDHPFARIGFVLASPVLWLNEGNREITITIKYDAKTVENNAGVFSECFDKFVDESLEDKKGDNTLTNFFQLEFSGEDGWFKPEKLTSVTMNSLQQNQSVELIFKVTLQANEPSVVFYDEEAIGEFFAAEKQDTKDLKPSVFPMVKIELVSEKYVECENTCEPTECCLAKKSSNAKKVELSLYHFLRHLKISSFKIDVKVCGVKNLIVQNEDSLQDVNSPIMPFGSRPKVGAEFYIGSKEVFCKNWDELSLYIDWKDKPKDLGKHYESYGGDIDPFEDNTSVIQDDSFKYEIGVRQDYVWEGLLNESVLEEDDEDAIFKSRLIDGQSLREECKNNTDAERSYVKELQKKEFSGLIDGNKLLSPDELEPFNTSSDMGFLRVLLKGVSFQHDRYALVLAGKLIEMSGGLDFNAISKMIEHLSEALHAHDSIKNELDTIKQKADELDNINILSDIDEQSELTELINAVNEILTSLNAPNAAGAQQRLALLHTNLESLEATLDKAGIGIGTGLPKEPYTPLIKTLEIDYCASADNTDIEFIHLYPFQKSSKTESLKTEEMPTLLPTFTDEGTLFIGLEAVSPRSNLQLLFQFAEATADSESQRAEVSWQYLANNKWEELRQGFELLSDTTEKMTRSGIVRIAVPHDISNKNNTMMPPTKDDEHLFWLKVSTSHSVESVAELISVHAQAALATYSPLPDSDTDRVGTALESKQISKTLQPDFGIKKVKQPYQSFGGQMAETTASSSIRMSEQLRHKGRSVDAFDIEHLVLDAFPELFKCKCISHSMGLSARQYQRDLEVAPGFLIVAVIPDLTQLESGDMLEPMAPVSTLTKVEKLLKQRTSPFARLRIMNPRYEKVHVKVNMQLMHGRDKNYYQSQLQTDIRHFLAPWHLGNSDKLSFGQHLTYSDVLGFIEGLEYIDHVSDLQFFDWRCQPSKSEYIAPLTARSILSPGEIEIEHAEKNCEKVSQQRSHDINSSEFLCKVTPPINCGEEDKLPAQEKTTPRTNQIPGMR